MVLQNPCDFHSPQCLLSNCQIFLIFFFRSTVSRSHSESESEYSASNSEDEEEVAQESEEDSKTIVGSQKSEAQNRIVSPSVCKETASKKMKREKTVSEEKDLRLTEQLCKTTKFSHSNRRSTEQGSTLVLVFVFTCLYFLVVI